MCVDMYGVCMQYGVCMHVYELCGCFQRPEAKLLFFNFPSDFCWRQGFPLFLELTDYQDWLISKSLGYFSLWSTSTDVYRWAYRCALLCPVCICWGQGSELSSHI